MRLLVLTSLLLCITSKTFFLDRHLQVGRQSSNYHAKGDFNNSVNTTGWAFLKITTNSQDSDIKQFYHAGYLEGYLTKVDTYIYSISRISSLTHILTTSRQPITEAMRYQSKHQSLCKSNMNGMTLYEIYLGCMSSVNKVEPFGIKFVIFSPNKKDFMMDT